MNKKTGAEIFVLTCSSRLATSADTGELEPAAAYITGSFLACWAAGPLAGSFSAGYLARLWDMIWRLQDPDAKLGNGPFLFCSWQCHPRLRDGAASKAAWLYSNGALAATAKCLRERTRRRVGLLGCRRLSNATELGIHFQLYGLTFSSLS